MCSPNLSLSQRVPSDPFIQDGGNRANFAVTERKGEGFQQAGGHFGQFWKSVDSWIQVTDPSAASLSKTHKHYTTAYSNAPWNPRARRQPPQGRI